MVDGYRLPQLVRGWEQGMTNFLLSRLGHAAADPLGALREALSGGPSPSPASSSAPTLAPSPAPAAPASGPSPTLAQPVSNSSSSASLISEADIVSLLAAQLRAGRLLLLLLHGEQDKLVPCSNSERLARLLPGCELVVVDNPGHTPQVGMGGGG